jgi:NitT/TauT family transport system permease protein
MASPWLVAFNAIPKVAFAPLLIIWLDLPTKPRIAMVVLICFFPIVLATVTGLTKTPAELVELGRSLDASRWQTFVKIRFPYALPQIFVGLKVAMPLAVIGAVIGEFAGGRLGLGQVIAQAGGAGNTALAFAAITVLAVMSIVLFYALVLLERLLLPWVRATTG